MPRHHPPPPPPSGGPHKSHYGECGWTDWLILRLSCRRFRRAGKRPDDASAVVFFRLAVCAGQRPLDPGRPGTTVGRWRGGRDGARAMAWLLSQLCVCTLLKGRRAPCTSLISEVRVKSSMTINSISAKGKEKQFSQICHREGDISISWIRGQDQMRKMTKKWVDSHNIKLKHRRLN